MWKEQGFPFNLIIFKYLYTVGLLSPHTRASSDTFIDFVSNTVTKKFAEAASQIAPLPEFHTMMQLREMTLTIVTNAPSKKNTQLTYGDSSILLWSDIQQHGVGALRPFPHPIGCIVPCIIINRISHRIPQI